MKQYEISNCEDYEDKYQLLLVKRCLKLREDLLTLMFKECFG